MSSEAMLGMFLVAWACCWPQLLETQLSKEAELFYGILDGVQVGYNWRLELAKGTIKIHQKSYYRVTKFRNIIGLKTKR